MRGNVDQSNSVGSIPFEATTAEWTAPPQTDGARGEVARRWRRKGGGGEGDKERQGRREEGNNE